MLFSCQGGNCWNIEAWMMTAASQYTDANLVPES